MPPRGLLERVEEGERKGLKAGRTRRVPPGGGGGTTVACWVQLLRVSAVLVVPDYSAHPFRGALLLAEDSLFIFLSSATISASGWRFLFRSSHAGGGGCHDALLLPCGAAAFLASIPRLRLVPFCNYLPFALRR